MSRAVVRFSGKEAVPDFVERNEMAWAIGIGFQPLSSAWRLIVVTA